MSFKIRRKHNDTPIEDRDQSGNPLNEPGNPLNAAFHRHAAQADRNVWSPTNRLWLPEMTFDLEHVPLPLPPLHEEFPVTINLLSESRFNSRT